MMFSTMRSSSRTTTVEGTTYTLWSDFVMRATFAESSATGEVKPISSSGYITNDLTVRKAIAARFGHNSFRK